MDNSEKCIQTDSKNIDMVIHKSNFEKEFLSILTSINNNINNINKNITKAKNDISIVLDKIERDQFEKDRLREEIVKIKSDLDKNKSWFF